MGNIFVTIGKDIEVAAEDLLKWVTKGASTAEKASPGVLAALGVLASAVEKGLTDVAQAAAAPLNIALDVQTVANLAAVWPDVKSFLVTLGIKV